MQAQFIQKIISEKTPCFFISPHLDDAVLSAGDLISHLSDKTEVHVVTIFTKTSEPETLSAKSFIRQSGYPDAETLFSDRRTEDKEVFNSIGAKVSHLGFVDGTWRKLEMISPLRRYLGKFIPELIHRYPVHQLHVVSGKINKEDLKMCDQINRDIKLLLEGINEYYIFCPAGIGKHVDHVVAKKVCSEMFPNAILWSDFPYNLKKGKDRLIDGYQMCEWESDHENKKELIGKYKTQAEAMFPGGNIPLISEIYYIPDKIHKKAINLLSGVCKSV